MGCVCVCVCVCVFLCALYCPSNVTLECATKGLEFREGEKESRKRRALRYARHFYVGEG